MDLLLDRTRRVETRHFWFRGFRRFVRPLVERAARGRRDQRLLDCGSGTGVNLAWLARFGRAWGVDLNAYGVALARSAGHARTARASVARLPFRDAAFDVVTSFDVLVCLSEEDERRAADEMFRVLRPGGAAVVNVAAMDILRGNHSVLSEEVRRYDRARLRGLLEAAGFAVERLTHTNTTLFPLVLVQRTLQRAVGLASPDRAAEGLRVPAAPVNEVLAGLLAVESVALRVVSFPFGSSLLCLARKPEAVRRGGDGGPR